ncbi:MAG: ADP-ribosylglycohydrolase family protein [Synergistales bacterium]|nr:ADP-ribosylglycohydrolase family protein [Synergistales bacterium]
MIGAIAGDVIGSVYEGRPVKRTDFPLFLEGSRFTDDTVLTVALADCLLSGGSYRDYLCRYGQAYPDAGFSSATRRRLLQGAREPANSLGNGAAMRVSPVGWAFDDEEVVKAEAEASALPTHGHPEGIRGAQAVALGVFWARRGVDRREIARRVESFAGYDLGTSIAELRPAYRFDATAPGSVPQAFRAFLEAGDFEEAVRLAVSLGGDADTLAAIAGALAEAACGPPPAWIADEVRRRLPTGFLDVIERFGQRYL